MDVFVSYSSIDRDLAERFVNALEAYGLIVWWDQRIEAGMEWSQEIETNLESARYVVVLWSQNSVASHFVREEARRGLRRNALVPIRIDGCGPPIGFGEIQTANLSAWGGLRHDADLQRVIARIQALIPGNRPIPTLEERAAVLEDRRKRAFKIYDIAADGSAYSVFVAEAEDVEAIDWVRGNLHLQAATDRDYLEYVLTDYLKHFDSIAAAIDDQNRQELRRPVASLAEWLQAVTDRAVSSYREQREKS